MEFIRDKAVQHGGRLARPTLYVNEEIAAQHAMKAQPGKSTLSGDGLAPPRYS